jgi:replicative DNA helicase
MNNPEYQLIALLLNYPENYEKIEKLSNIFYDNKCNYIFSIMQKQKKFNVDTIRQVAKCRINDVEFDKIYEDTYFEEDQLESYTEYIQSQYAKRKVIKFSNELKHVDYMRFDEIKENIEKIVVDIDKSNDEEIQDSQEIIEEMQRDDATICKLEKSWIRYLDKWGGYESTDLIYIAARPSVGKTTYVLNLMAEDLKNDVPAGFFTVETNSKKIMSILACIFAAVEELKYRTNQLDENEKNRLAKSFEKLYNKKIYFDKTANIKIRSLAKKARKMVKKHGVKKIYIDYIQLITCNDKNIKSRYELVTYISQQLKGLTKELEIPIICLAQLNRLSENAGREPRISDLKESGAMEQDGDVIILLHPDGDKIKNIVGKWRNGPQGAYYTLFNKPLRRIRDYG